MVLSLLKKNPSAKIHVGSPPAEEFDWRGVLLHPSRTSVAASLRAVRNGSHAQAGRLDILRRWSKGHISQGRRSHSVSALPYRFAMWPALVRHRPHWSAIPLHPAHPIHECPLASFNSKLTLFAGSRSYYRSAITGCDEATTLRFGEPIAQWRIFSEGRLAIAESPSGGYDYSG